MDGKDMTTAGDANWRAACESEARARDAWQERWGWIRDEYRTLSAQLEQLKGRRPQRQECEQSSEPRSVLPFPVTTAREVGWLSGRPQFQLEVLGPYPYTARARPPINPPSANHGLNY